MRIQILALLLSAAFVLPIGPVHAQTPKSGLGFHAPDGFDTAVAMVELFGNFDPKTESSQYHVPKTTVLDLKGSSFKLGDDIVVHPLWASAAEEEGKQKIVFLTFAVPKDSFGKPETDTGVFECHSCTPLIGAAVFVRDGDRWQVESSRAVVSRGGGFGSPPNRFRVIEIGRDRIGIEMSDTYVGQGEAAVSRTIMVPWKGKVNESLGYTESNDNRGGCGGEEPPCFSNRRTPIFVHRANPDYFDLRLTLSGTVLPDNGPYKPKSVHKVERFVFEDGYYKPIKLVTEKKSQK